MTSKLNPNSNSPSAWQEFAQRLGILGELLAFLWKRKLYWMLPMVITLIVFALVILFGSASPLSPFIYTLF